MHNAPSVEYPVGRCRFQARVLWGVWFAAALASAAWAWPAARPTGHLALAAFVLTASAGLSWRSWRTTPSGHLAWDGSTWQWKPCEGACVQPGTVRAHWHGQRCLLLEFMPFATAQRWTGRWWAGPIWLWLVSSSAPERWLDMRRAVYSRPGRSSSAPNPS